MFINTFLWKADLTNRYYSFVYIMSRIRTTVSRLLALGGLTALSGSSLALYRRYSILGDTAECRPNLNAFNFKDTENIVKERVSHEWDDDWDRRKPRYKKTLKDQTNEPSITVVENNGQTTNVPVNPPPEVPTPTATRHVILVRHGQYNMNTKIDHEKILTTIGR